MSKIKLFALGGQNENGKNMYVIEINDDILVFEAGLNYTAEETLGIDYVIPNIDYLKENKKRIKGIFLTHAHDENIGALADIIEDLSGIKIYGSKITIDMVKEELENCRIKSDDLVEIKPYKSLNIGKNSIFPVQLSHSIPGNFGYAIYTEDGVIFYATDFVLDSLMDGPYKTDIGKLAYIGKQGVLCLITGSMYAEKAGFTSPNHRISNIIRETLNKAEGRIIFNVLTSHLYRIQELFNEVSKTDRKIVIMGKKLQNIVSDSLVNGYLKIDKKFIGDLSNINDENVVILTPNEMENPYYNVIKMINGYDKFIKLNENDTIFLATPVYEGIEKTYYRLLDDIAKKGCDIVTLSKKNLSYNASSEDLMMMIDLMQPKYYYPARGEYRYMYANANLAEANGIPKENILLKLNGDVSIFEKGNLVECFDKVQSGSISIDGKSNDDVGELVIKDREMLSNNGIMIVTSDLDKKTKQILSGPEILTRGFVYVKDSTELINQLKELCTKIILDNTKNNYIEYGRVKNLIRDELSKFLIIQTGNKPMIITVIQEI